MVLVAMTGSLSMIMLDATIVGVALPSIGRDMDFTATQQSWAVSGYLVAMASWIALGGRIGDWLGRMRAFRIGMVGFALASIACALSTTAWVFVGARVLQGVFAATMQPASAAIVIDLYPPERRGRAMATYAGISLLFLAGGPLVGGALVEHASWHWCFWLNAPIAAGALLLTMIIGFAPAKGIARKVDWPSVAVLLTGTPLLVAGLLGVRGGLGTVTASASMALGAVLLVIFGRRQWTLATPTIDLRLMRDRTLLAEAMVLLSFQFINTGQGIYGAYFMQSALGFTPVQSGLGTIPLLLPVLVLVHFAGRWYDKVGPRRPIVTGVTIALVGTIVETAGVVLLNYPILAVGMALFGCGAGLAMSPTNADSLSRAPTHQRAEVAGLVQACRQFGSVLGVALFVLVMQFAPSADDGALWSPRAIANGFALHAFIALGAVLVARRWIKSGRPARGVAT